MLSAAGAFVRVSVGVRPGVAAALRTSLLSRGLLRARSPAVLRALSTAAKGGKKKSGKDSAPAAAAASSASSEEEGAAAGGGDEELEGKDLKTSLARQVEFARRELSKLRGATANPSMLDHVTVEAYGERQALKDIAQIALKGPALIMVNPFDSALAEAISDAIRDADLNLNPSVDGNAVKVPVPKTSKETREATVKLISKIAEQAKTRIRRVRGAALEKLKKAEGVSEDDTRRESKAVEEAVTAATAEVAALADKKKREVEAA